MLAKLKALDIAPSAPASDATFIRRAYLDAAGILPTSGEVEDFLSDTSPDKRAKLIDRLLTRDEFIDYWTYKWSRPAAGFQPQAGTQRHVVVLQLDSRERPHRQTLE